MSNTLFKTDNSSDKRKRTKKVKCVFCNAVHMNSQRHSPQFIKPAEIWQWRNLQWLNCSYKNFQQQKKIWDVYGLNTRSDVNLWLSVSWGILRIMAVGTPKCAIKRPWNLPVPYCANPFNQVRRRNYVQTKRQTDTTSTKAALFNLRRTKFYICGSVHRNSRLKKTNEMQLYADIYLLLKYSTCFGRPSRP